MHFKGIRGGMGVLVAAGMAVAITATAAAATSLIARFSGDLRDFRTTEAGPFDHATARLQLVDRTSGTTAVLHVRGIDPSVAGRTFGAHLHDGPCATDNPSGALGHYNADTHAGHLPAVVSDRTEVWLDFTVDAAGAGDSSTAVRFPVQPGARSIVIHADPTNPATGAAGARLACLPVEW
jgi:Cu/Zn superoxide dismutase